MSAKEMFEELGYKQQINYDENGKIKNITYSKNKTKDFSKIRVEYIFSRTKSFVARRYYVKGKDTRIYTGISIPFEHYKAINKQIKELNWDNE